MARKYSFLRAVMSVGKPSTEPMRSAMALRDVVRRRLRGARSSLSRTTSDFEILRPRDSASMSATKGSGNRTVRVFMNSAYYLSDSSARQTAEPADSDIVSVPTPPPLPHWRTRLPTLRRLPAPLPNSLSRKNDESARHAPPSGALGILITPNLRTIAAGAAESIPAQDARMSCRG